MSHWVCEDVGLVINELRDKFSEKLNQLTESEGEKMDPKTEDIIRGMNMAYDILDEVADSWTSEQPSEEVLNKIRKHYGDNL